MHRVCPNIYWKLLIEEGESFVLKKRSVNYSICQKAVILTGILITLMCVVFWGN